jgi:glucose/arabinose dehydrogenase
MKKHIFFTVLFFFETIFSFAQTPHLKLTLFTSGLNQITDIKNAGDGRLFVVEQTGMIYILDSAGNINPQAFLDLTNEVFSSSNDPEAGLLSIVFSPHYKSDGYFYVTYSDVNFVEHIVRFHVNASNPNEGDPASETPVLTVYHPFPNHFSGELQFGPDGYLYIGLGDGGGEGDPGNRAQNLDSLLGKILRIDVTNLPYTIPPSNPFINNPNARPEIWAYGVRNPWKFDFDKITNDLWIADVGQDKYEEIDFQKANDTGGINYGWHCYEADSLYKGTGNTKGSCGPPSDYTFPIFMYPHVGVCTAVIGGYIYRGALFSSLFGNFLFTDECTGQFRAIVKSDSNTFTETNLLQGDQFAYNTFGVDQYGEMYVGESGGEIFKVEDTSCAPVAFTNANNTLEACGGDTVLHALFNPLLTYQWYKNDTAIAGATRDSIVATTNGNYSIRATNNSSCTSVSSAVNVILNTCLGIKNIPFFKNANLKPNPNNGKFALEINVLSNAQCEETISNAIGQKIYSQNIFLHSGTNNFSFSLKLLPGGIYFFKIKSFSGNLVKRFVIQ